MRRLAVALAQPRIRSHDVTANVAAHAGAIRSAGARVVVFPELSLTGYELEAEPISPSDTRLEPLVEACAAADSVALVGAPVADGAGARCIAMLAVDGARVRVAYRKVHLGGDEPSHFVPGPSPAVIEVDGWRLGLAICKDTGAPEHAAAMAALGVDAYLAGVCELAADDQEKDRRARRIAAEHGVWVAVASFAGPTGGGFDLTAGRSTIWAPGGAQVARAGVEPGEVVRAELRPPPGAAAVRHAVAGGAP